MLAKFVFMLHKKQKQLAKEDFDIVLSQIIVPVAVDNNQSSARLKDARPFRCSPGSSKCASCILEWLKLTAKR